MEQQKNDKIERILGIYTRLLKNERVNRVEEAARYGINERSVQRDINDIRNFLEMNGDNSDVPNTVVYDRADKSYKLEQSFRSGLTNSEILAVCKVLLDSRGFTKEEMTEVLNKLISCCVPKENVRLVTDLISNELFHYIEPRHRVQCMDMIWDIGQAVRSCRCIEIDYLRMKDKAVVKRKVKPAAVMFSEYYFYLTAFIDDEDIRKGFDVVDDSFPTIYRFDRIKKLKVLDEKFHIPYSSRFEEGEFRKRVQFMYGGKLRRVKFKYTGPDIDAVLDRLPTAKVVSGEEGGYIVSAEVFGKGIDMWLRSQGNMIEKVEEKIGKDS